MVCKEKVMDLKSCKNRVKKNNNDNNEAQERKFKSDCE